MTIKEKIELSMHKNRFTLYREGLFYKCYNEDAMIFTEHVKSYKVSSKFVKNVDGEVLSLGFPVSETENGRLCFDKISEALGSDKRVEEKEQVVFYLKQDIKQGFEKWGASVVEVCSGKFVAKKSINIESENKELNEKIINYDLANSTPMQGLTFIQELKSIVQKLNQG